MRPKGTPKTGGRQKGTPNKTTASVREMILGALDAKDGQAWIEEQMDKNPVAFMSLLGKILPSQVEVGEPGGFTHLSDEELRTRLDEIVEEARKETEKAVEKARHDS